MTSACYYVAVEGATLFTAVLLPSEQGTYPTVLMRSPYVDKMQELSEGEICAQLLEENKATVKVLHSPDKWFGVTYAADKPVVVAALKKMTEEGKYPDGLWK